MQKIECVLCYNGSAGSASSRKGSEIDHGFLTLTWESQRNLHQSIWEALENMDWLFFTHIKFYSFMFMHKIIFSKGGLF